MPAAASRLAVERLEERRLLAVFDWSGLSSTPDLGNGEYRQDESTTIVAAGESHTYQFQMKAGDVLVVAASEVDEPGTQDVSFTLSQTGGPTLDVSDPAFNAVDPNSSPVSLGFVPSASPVGDTWMDAMSGGLGFDVSDPFVRYVAVEDGDYEVTLVGDPLEDINYRVSLQLDASPRDQGTQYLYLDFDGEVGVTKTDYGTTAGGAYDVLSFSNTVQRLGLTDPDATDDLVDAIVAVVRENMRTDVVASDADVAGYDLQIVDSRQNAITWGMPGVSRVLVDGRAFEQNVSATGGLAAGAGTGLKPGDIGKSGSDDTGNFSREDSAIVLTNGLAITPGVNDFTENPITPGSIDKLTNVLPRLDASGVIDTTDADYGVDAFPVGTTDRDRNNVIAVASQVIGNVISHEAGHMLGLEHLDAQAGVMTGGPATEVNGNGLIGGQDKLYDPLTGDNDDLDFLRDGLAEEGTYNKVQDSVAILGQVTRSTPRPRVFELEFGSTSHATTHAASRDAGFGTQLASIPVGQIDRFTVDFKTSVDLTNASATLIDAETGQAIEALQLVTSTVSTTATWESAGDPVPFGKQAVFTLDGVVGAAGSDADGVALDGEWTNPRSYDPDDVFPSTVLADGTPLSTFPSGNGQPGGAFSYYFTVLPDVDRDNAVGPAELTAVTSGWDPGGSGSAWGDGDFNGDGAIGPFDYTSVTLHWDPSGADFLQWPTSAPAAPMAMMGLGTGGVEPSEALVDAALEQQDVGTGQVSGHTRSLLLAEQESADWIDDLAASLASEDGDEGEADRGGGEPLALEGLVVGRFGV